MNDITLVEVGPRDGLQNEKTLLSVETKRTFIEHLITAGLSIIEAGSFVSPAAVPAMADTDALLAQLPLEGPQRFPVLVPNEKGLARAVASGARDIAVFAAASETFSQKNIRCSVEDSLLRFKTLIPKALAEGMRVRGYVSCVMGCPYEGSISHEAVLRVTQALLEAGCDEVSLGDTIGVGTPADTRALLKALCSSTPVERLALHCHDTYGQALANICEGLNAGIRTIDSATSGLGGCPYAKGATGNVATEDVVYCLQGLGLQTGVSLDALVDASAYIAAALGQPPRSKVACALLAKR